MSSDKSHGRLGKHFLCEAFEDKRHPEHQAERHQRIGDFHSCTNTDPGPGVLDKLEKHYEALLKTGLNLDVGEVVPTATPSLPAIKKHLASMTSVLNGSHPIVEKQETDTNSFHKSLLDPLALLARVSMADGGSVLTKVAAESLDEELRELHPHVVTQRAHDMQGSGSGSGSNSTTPDHTILAEYEENTTNLMSIEDKNTAFGHTKWRDLDDLVGKGQIKGMADAPKVWRQVSQLLLLLSSRTLWP
jgi:hypothetical protein